MTSAAVPPPPRPAGPAPSGALAWWLGLVLLLTCVPVLSNVLATVAAVLVHRSTDRRAGFAREVTRRAANLQLTLALATVLLLGVHVLLLFLLTRGEPQSGFFPIGIAISLVPVLGLYACVLSVVSAVRAGRGRLTPAVGAIGFFRR